VNGDRLHVRACWMILGFLWGSVSPFLPTAGTAGWLVGPCLLGPFFVAAFLRDRREMRADDPA
jgi:hypothetical protein